ncbi:hypothetical protein [Deinococcus humi]|uniref:Putative nucleotidyltransferase n=1 Tax=Deinococcus humi TaxID=662880 RepID=A0A7W8JXJ8_9DEIO|nr:hypothetical protein [Deinococcus humi]MBB5364840.1 putative nucleotidyltransferase [Deinococcus humi]GGO33937.1 hypothetical protein GCM10008949_33960 [Deinococcus humi]
MAWTVYGAFCQFRDEVVDLPPELTEKARLSLYSITTRVAELAEQKSDFPRLGAEPLVYGSFARKTQCQPLDDLDLLVVLEPGSARPTSIRRDRFGFDLEASRGPLARFTGAFLDDVNSRSVLDAIRNEIKGLRDLEVESVDRRLQAVRLKLDFYDWNFDLVPAVPVVKDGMTQHYLIPNGNGDWWRTDPRADADRLTAALNRHGKAFLSLVRLVKYWNATQKPRLGSYHLETLVANVMQDKGKMYTLDLPELLARCFGRLTDAVFQPCPDPKGLGPDLDLGVDWLRRTQISENASWAAYFTEIALEYDKDGETEDAFGAWRDVFGKAFPSYGSE